MSEKGPKLGVPRYRRYTAAQKRETVALCFEMGGPEASRETGIPYKTLEKWYAKARRAAEGMARGSDSGTQSSGVSESKLGRQNVANAGSSGTSSTEASAAVSKEEDSPSGEPRRRVVKRYTPSEKARALEVTAEQGVAEASKRLGISRFSLYYWKSQLQKVGSESGDDPTSGPDPKDVERLRDREILNEWGRHPGLGPSQIVNQLRRKGVKTSVHTARRVMTDNGYRPPKVIREPHEKRFEAVRPNHLWHLDYVHRYINSAPTFVLIIMDDCSRFVTGFGVDDAERADLVIQTFEEAVERHGRPERVIHDKGSAFWSWRGISRFTRLLEELGIDQIPAKHKEWNGKLEVFNANLSKELFETQRFSGLSELRRQLKVHLHWYNHQRTSHALGGVLVPADRFYGRVEEVKTRLENGLGKQGDIHQLNLARRSLELFRVVYQNGRPEVYLMGERLLPHKS